MDDRIAFLHARLDDDERLAREATPGPWEARDDNLDGWSIDPLVAWPGYDVRSGVDKQFDAEHIARHDPARVLREVDAKRRILDDCEERRSVQSDNLVRLLAVPYADHPEYREEWKP